MNRLFEAACIAHGLHEPVAEFRFAPPRLWRFDWCWASMEKLRHLGLVTWDNGRQKTLRATCRFLPKGEL